MILTGLDSWRSVLVGGVRGTSGCKRHRLTGPVLKDSRDLFQRFDRDVVLDRECDLRFNLDFSQKGRNLTNVDAPVPQRSGESACVHLVSVRRIHGRQQQCLRFMRHGCPSLTDLDQYPSVHFATGVSAVERASRTNPAPSPSETLIARNAPTLVFGGVIPSRCKPERIHRACCWAVSDVPKNPSLLLNGELFRTAKTVCSSDSGAQLDLTPSETMTRARVFHFQPCSTALLRPSRRVSSGSRKTLRPCYVSRFRGFWLRYRRSQQVVPTPSAAIIRL